MPDYSDHTWMLKELAATQDADEDNREKARECKDFVTKRDGQWEPDILSRYESNKRPRYTFDMVNPIVNQISGEMKKADFVVKIKPESGDATKENAKLLDGLIRNIQNKSNAVHIYNRAGKNMVTTGIDGWVIKQQYVEGNSFDQELVIKPVPSFPDSVWFDMGSVLQDRSDANFAWFLSPMTVLDYTTKYPEGSKMSVGQDRDYSSYYNKPETVIVGDFYYKKPYKRTIARMTSGDIIDLEESAQVLDELAAAGNVPEETRTVTDYKVMVRRFDGSNWLGEEQETVFKWIPLIPTYGDFDVVEGKVIYRGAVDKLMDPARVRNYAISRMIEETALSPKEKIAATKEQIKGHEKSWSSLNTDTKAVLPYNHVDGVNPPYKLQGASLNPGTQMVSQEASNGLTQASGMFAANMGDNPGLQSGVAIDSLKESGDTGTIDYFESQEIAICHTGRILVDAIPKVYDGRRQVRVLGEDGSFDMETLNDQIFDQQTQQWITVNDLSVGTYDVVCETGKNYKSRQQEGNAAFNEVATVMPELLQTNADIYLQNVSAPGMDEAAERARAQLFQAGAIPQAQWTDEEIAQVQQQQAMAAQQGEQPDPMMVAAQAEMQKAQAEMAKVQIGGQKNELEMMKSQMDAQYKIQQLELQTQKQEIEFAEKQQKANLSQEQFDFNSFMAIQKAQADQQAQQMAMLTQVIDDRNTMADTLKKLKETMGVDAMVGPQMAQAVAGEASDLIDAQE